MFFSVIIPNYNHAKFLDSRIQSVLNQSYKNFEVIILDDCSTDNSREIILKYLHYFPITHIVFNKKNSGSPFLQWKQGIDLTSYDWIWIAESDDLTDRDFLKSAFEVLQTHKDVNAYYGDSFVIDENNAILDKASAIKNNFFETQNWSKSYKAKGIQELNRYLKFLCTINNVNAFLFKKEIFTAIQNDIVTYRYYGDWFLYINASMQTTIYYNHPALSSYRNHSQNLIGRQLPVVESTKEYFRLLLFLMSRKEVTGKKEMLNFFCLHYLGWGWITHGMGKGFSIMKNYLKMDTNLALKIIPKLFWYKITGKKNRKPYP